MVRDGSSFDDPPYRTNEINFLTLSMKIVVIVEQIAIISKQDNYSSRETEISSVLAHKRGTLGILGWLAIVVAIAFALLGVAIVDTVTVPAICAVDRNIVLPDRCRGTCPAVSLPNTACCSVTATRPYLLFFTQDAACVCPNLGCGTLG